MHNYFSCMFISVLYTFRAGMCLSSGELIVSIRHLVYVTHVDERLVRRFEFHSNLHTRRSSTRVAYTRCIDTINSPDDGHMAARKMQRIEINVHEKELCVKLVIYKDYTEMHGQQNIKVRCLVNKKDEDVLPSYTLLTEVRILCYQPSCHKSCHLANVFNPLALELDI